MALELNGTTGITTPDITSEAGLTADGVSFASGAPANTLVTTSGGNVGIGTSSPDSGGLHINSGLGFLTLERSGTGFDGKFRFVAGGLDGGGFRIQDGTTDRLAIDSSGNLLVGKTVSTNYESGCKFLAGAGGSAVISSDNDALQVWADNGTANTGGLKGHIVFKRGTNGVIVGSITSSTTATAYNTSSDYRLKENVVGVTGASARVQQLNPVRFNFIADPDTTVDGFLAHEVQDVVPEAITGTKDATEMVDVHDEDGNVTGQEERPVYQGIDQSKLVPLLTAALQEALGKIETLEARVAALEAA